jgi:hypothetical protein
MCNRNFHDVALQDLRGRAGLQVDSLVNVNYNVEYVSAVSNYGCADIQFFAYGGASESAFHSDYSRRVQANVNSEDAGRVPRRYVSSVKNRPFLLRGYSLQKSLHRRVNHTLSHPS